MGSGAGKANVRKTAYFDINGKTISVEFTGDCNPQELKELLAISAGINKCDSFTISTPTGTLFPINSSLPANTASTCYKLTVVRERKDELKEEILDGVKEEITRKDEIIGRFSDRLAAIERKLENKDDASGSTSKPALQNQATASLTPPDDSLVYSKYHKHVVDNETSQCLKEFHFNAWEYQNEEMIYFTEHMYKEFGLTTDEEINIDTVVLQRWLFVIQQTYRDNPFHNFRHAFCVTQMMYGLTHSLQLTEVFSKLELAVLLTAAICHDLDHPGLSNSYQINARTELAIRYNDISPLENHHCATAFKMLEKPRINIFANVSLENFRKIRAGIIELILSTDMSRHSDILEDFRNALEQGMDFENKQHRSLLKRILIKCCDVSNELRPNEMANQWADCLLMEYYTQCDKEKEEGLPISPFMDRDVTTKVTSQLKFIKDMLIPIFGLMTKLFPKTEELLLNPLKLSLDHYERLKLKEDAEEEKAAKKGRKKKWRGNKVGQDSTDEGESKSKKYKGECEDGDYKKSGGGGGGGGKDAKVEEGPPNFGRLECTSEDLLRGQVNPFAHTRSVQSM